MTFLQELYVGLNARNSDMNRLSKNRANVNLFRTVHCEFLEYWNTPKSVLEDLTTFFMSTWLGDSENMEEIEFSRWLFEGRPRKGKNKLPDGLNWLCYLAGSSKSHRENSISFIFLESPYLVDMKNVVKSSKHFFGYFNILETHSDTKFFIKLIEYEPEHSLSSFFHTLLR